MGYSAVMHIMTLNRRPMLDNVKSCLTCPACPACFVFTACRQPVIYCKPNLGYFPDFPDFTSKILFKKSMIVFVDKNAECSEANKKNPDKYLV